MRNWKSIFLVLQRKGRLEMGEIPLLRGVLINCLTKLWNRVKTHLRKGRCIIMAKSREEFWDGLKSQKFGIEIELTGISKSEVREVLSGYLYGYQYRGWTVKGDSSILAKQKINGCLYDAGSEYRVELVSPILGYADIPVLQEIIRRIRKRGGISDAAYRCGIHIHVSDDGHNEVTLRNLIRLMVSKQYLLQKALMIPDSRLESYCQYVNIQLAKRSERKFRDMHALQKSWYDSSTRYSMLNLSSMFDGKGIEFRLFNGSMHSGKVKAYVQFSLALAQAAKDLTRCCSKEPKNYENDRYAMRTWLLRLHLIGDEFKTCRKFMLENLSGESAFADPSARKNYNFGISEDFDWSDLPFD